MAEACYEPRNHFSLGMFSRFAETKVAKAAETSTYHTGGSLPVIQSIKYDAIEVCCAT